MLEWILQLDGAIAHWFAANNNVVIREILSFITTLGNEGMLWIGLAVVLLFFKKTRAAGVAVAVALILSALIVNVTIKPLVSRLRPFQMYDSIKFFLKVPPGYSFPSGHAASSLAAATAMYLTVGEKEKKYGVIALCIAAMIAFSRVYLGAHFPTDVIVGVIIGIICGLIGFKTAGLTKFKG